MAEGAFGFAGGIIISIIVALAVGVWRQGEQMWASDYCAEHDTIAVGQYCLTEAEIILRRVPERF